MLRWCDSLRVPRTQLARALQSTGRIQELEFSNSATSEHFSEMLVNAFSHHLNANEMSR